MFQEKELCSRSTRETLDEVIEFIHKISKKRVITKGDKQTAYFKVLALPEGEKQEALEVYRQKILKSSEGSVEEAGPEYAQRQFQLRDSKLLFYQEVDKVVT